VPGFAVDAAAHLFCMHDPAVRQWIGAQRSVGDDSFILVTPDDWRNPGGVDSLTFPIEDRDAAELAAIWDRLTTSCAPAQPPRPDAPTGPALTPRQAIVLRALYDGHQLSARHLKVRSDVLWRMEELGLVTRAWGPARSPDAQWRIRPAGVSALGRHTARQAGRLARSVTEPVTGRREPRTSAA
jgi:hypothetical protein